MGADLARVFPCARRVFDEIDDALQQNLSRLMFEGAAVRRVVMPGLALCAL